MKNPLMIFFILVLLFRSVTSGYYSSPLDWFISHLLIVPGIVIGLSFHEYAHAKVAVLCGDDTPRLQGRVTIQPSAHIDPIGLLALFFIGFGWGKPVEINPRNFRKMRRDEILVGLAGVTMNLFIAILSLIILRLIFNMFGEYTVRTSALGSIVYDIISNIVSINVVLMVFNLIPVPPLDGFGVLAGICNFRYKPIYYEIYEKGWLILMLLILFNGHQLILLPVSQFVLQNLAGLILY